MLLLVVTSCGEPDVAKPAAKGVAQVYRSVPGDYHAKLKTTLGCSL